MAKGLVQERCAEKLKVLADPTRLSVVDILLGGSHTVGGINAVLGIDLSLLSHHLRVLREAGLVLGVRRGKEVHYRLAPLLAHRRGGRNVLDLGCCDLRFEADA